MSVQNEIESKVVSISRNAMAGISLDPFPPYPDGWIISGNPDHHAHNSFMGSIHVGVYEASSSKLRLVDYPADEFMMVLSGSVVITDDHGERFSFFPGDCFILVKGFNGSFEMKGLFRKLAVAAGSPDGTKVKWLDEA